MPKTRQKILFLDVDGVLNGDIFYLKSMAEMKKLGLPFDNSGLEAIDPVNVALLKRLLCDEDCDVVLSSTWRLVYNKPPLEIFKTLGFDMSRWIGMTPKGYPGIRFSETPNRGLEIQKWIIDNNAFDANIVILDDVPIGMKHLSHRLVQTNENTGLVESDLEKVRNLFLTPDKAHVRNSVR